MLRPYQAKHLAMIRHMAITLTTDDLCSEDVRKQTEIMADANLCDVYQVLEKGEKHVYAFFLSWLYAKAAAAVLREIWVRKLFFVRHHFPQLEDLNVSFRFAHRNNLSAKEPPVSTFARDVLVKGTAFAEVIRFPDIRVKMEPSHADEENTLINCVNDAHVRARTTLEDSLFDVMGALSRDAKWGQGFDRDLLGRDWCTVRLRGHHLSSEQAKQA